MSDEIGHHCGIALIRLRKPLAYYEEKYGTPLWGFNQLFLLMEKQHNRGQDGAGIGSMKLICLQVKHLCFAKEVRVRKLWRKFLVASIKNSKKWLSRGCFSGVSRHI